jgi:hypothetical protein
MRTDSNDGNSNSNSNSNSDSDSDRGPGLLETYSIARREAEPPHRVPRCLTTRSGEPPSCRRHWTHLEESHRRIPRLTLATSLNARFRVGTGRDGLDLELDRCSTSRR